jgi:hypothetical protein
MAPSSLLGHAGYGIFTTRDLAKSERGLGGPGPDGISVPVEGLHREFRGFEKGYLQKKAWIALWDNYWWARGVPDHVSYLSGPDMVDFQTLFGALPNHQCLLDLLNMQYPDPPYDDSLVSRFKDPGAGAFSYNMGREFIVDREMKAGDELFLSYGYCKHGGDNPDWTNHIFMPSDFDTAADIIWDNMRQYDSFYFFYFEW